MVMFEGYRRRAAGSMGPLRTGHPMRRQGMAIIGRTPAPPAAGKESGGGGTHQGTAPMEDSQ